MLSNDELDSLWVELLSGEMTPERADEWREKLKADPDSRPQVTSMRRQIMALKKLQAASDLALMRNQERETGRGIVSFRAMEATSLKQTDREQTPSTPTEAVAALKTIPDRLHSSERPHSVFAATGLGTVSASSALPKHPTRLHPAGIAQARLAARRLVGNRVPRSMLVVIAMFVGIFVLRWPQGVVNKGVNSHNEGALRHRMDIILVGRALGNEPAYHVPIERLREDLYGARVRRDQAILPVLDSPELDLSLAAWYCQILLVDSSGQGHFAQETPGAFAFKRVPDTKHLYSYERGVQLSEIPGLPSGILRLHVVLTRSLIRHDQLSTLLSTRPNQDIVSPQPLLSRLSQIEGIEGTILIDVH